MESRMESYMNRILCQYSGCFSSPKNIRRWSYRAFLYKYHAISGKEKVRLLAKLFIRLFGVHKCLYLGGYRWEEDYQQQMQDLKVYCNLCNHKINYKMEFKNLACINNEYEQPDLNSKCKQTTEQMKKLLNDRSAYIALVTENLDKGGLEEVVKMLATECHMRDLPIRVFCLQEGGQIANSLKNIGIEVIFFYGKLASLDEYLKNDKPILVNTHFIKANYLEIFKRHYIPIVEVIHNMYVFLTHKNLLKEQAKVALVSHYISVSETAEEIFRQKISLNQKVKITTIGNAVKKIKKAEQTRLSVRKSLGILDETFIFLSAGSIDPRKNQIGILRAWDIVRHMSETPAILILAGAGSDNEYEQKVKRMLQERQFENSVLMIGHCSDIYSLMHASDVFIIDSYYEGWSMAATEALYNGLPLIHSNCGSGVELIANGMNGILIDNPIKNIVDYNSVTLYDAMHAGINENIDQMVSAMLSMLEGRKEWKARKTNIIQYAEQNFPVSNMIEQYLTVFIEECDCK